MKRYIIALSLLATASYAGVQNQKTQSFNQSSRAYVQTGDNILIGGLIVGGKDYVKVVIRAMGPSVPVPNRLLDPTLELHGPDGALLVSQNSYLENTPADNATIAAAGLTPGSVTEVAIVAVLKPGNYTAQVRGAGGTVGNALVEFYKIQ